MREASLGSVGGGVLFPYACCLQAPAILNLPIPRFSGKVRKGRREDKTEEREEGYIEGGRYGGGEEM